MENKKKSNSWMLILAALMLTASITYALITENSSQNLSTSLANPVWDVDIADASVLATSGTATSNGVETDATTVSMNTTLALPGDSITYSIVVENNGNIDAELRSIWHNMDELTEKYNAVTYEISGISVGDVLKPGEKVSFTVKVLLDEEQARTNFNDTLIVTLDYDQK